MGGMVNTGGGVVKIMETAEKYTYKEYSVLGEANMGDRYELIDGVVYLMSPSASQVHQEISFEIAWQLGNFLRGKPCKAFTAPFDVCINAEGDDDRTTVQPDIIVVCDKSKLDGKRCNGAPDLIIEILSPSNRKHDLYTKFKAYMQAGVREYWIVDPDERIVTVNILVKGEYMAQVYDEKSIVPTHVLEGCTIDLNDVFV
jgi:Uma2 family endonuclease